MLEWSFFFNKGTLDWSDGHLARIKYKNGYFKFLIPKDRVSSSSASDQEELEVDDSLTLTKSVFLLVLGGFGLYFGADFCKLG